MRVLLRDLCDRNIEDVEVLAPDQIQQQVEGTLECFEKHFKSMRRYVQVSGKLCHRLAGYDGEWHFALRNGAGFISHGRCRRYELEFGFSGLSGRFGQLTKSGDRPEEIDEE